MIDLNTLLRTRGCGICDHLAGIAFEFFCHFQHDSVTKLSVQNDFAAQGGFCPLHAWQLAAISSPHGLSVGLSPLAEHLAAELAERAKTSNGTVANLVAHSYACAVCLLLRDTEVRSVRQVAEMVAEPTHRDLFARSQGLCLGHLNQLLAIVQDDGARSFLIRHTAGRFDKLARDMRAYVVKRETLRRSLINNDEADAYRHFLVHVFGDRRLCLPWGL
jgi:hypothetical protein